MFMTTTRRHQQPEPRTVTLATGETITFYWASTMGQWVTIPARDED